MIIYNPKKVNRFSQKCIKEYEETINYSITECPICGSENIIKWGSYLRNVIYYNNNKKYEKTIEIKRIMCKNCNKTNAIIPSFLVPYKIHVTEYITEVVKNKLTKENNYNQVSRKYQISRQLIKCWLDCFNAHLTRIEVTLSETNIRQILRIIKKELYKFIYQYYYENKIIYLMYISEEKDMPILKWAPT